MHILLKSGPAGLSRFMRRLLTGYAVSYNIRHQRHGHVFQNRYKSIVCDEDAYFQELVRYIHLNPLNGPNDCKSEFVKLVNDVPGFLFLPCGTFLHKSFFVVRFQRYR